MNVSVCSFLVFLIEEILASFLLIYHATVIHDTLAGVFSAFNRFWLFLTPRQMSYIFDIHDTFVVTS